MGWLERKTEPATLVTWAMGVLSVSVPNVARLALPRLTLAEHGRRGFGDALRANLRAEAPNPSLVRLERPPRELANAGRVWAEVAALAPAPTMAEPLLLRRHKSSPGGVAFPGVAMVSTFGPATLTPSQFEQVLAHELGHLVFWHRLGRHLSTPTQAVFNDLLSANIDEVVECFDQRFAESQLPTWFAVRRRAALAHPALVAEAPLERAVRFARIMRPYDELFADSVATLRAGRPLNITDFGYQPVKNDVRNFASTDTFSARELHLNYGALVHMRALLGRDELPHARSLAAKRRLLERLERASAAEIEAIFTHRHPTLRAEEFDANAPLGADFVRRLNLALLERTRATGR